MAPPLTPRPKRPFSLTGDDKENHNNDNNNKESAPKTQKILSFHIDKKYRNLLKECNATVQKRQAQPNLNPARNRNPPTPPPGTSRDHSSPQDGATNQDWIQPRKTFKPSTNASDSSKISIPENRYNPLLDDELELDENTPNEQPNNSIPKTKTYKPPPIYTINSNINTIINTILEHGIPKNEFLVKENDSNYHTIFTNKLQHHKDIMDRLTEKTVQFYTYTPKEEKPKSILLKGIKGNFSEDDIIQEISDLNLPDIRIINLSKFTFDKQQPDKHHHLIQLSSDSRPSNLFKIKTLAYQRVKWEHLRKPAIFQCKKCQRLGHASKNCSLQYRCVKCAQSHDPGKCPLNAVDNRDKLRCANCNQAGHPASYKGCPYIKYAIKQKREADTRRTQTTSNKIQKIATAVSQNISFSQMVKGHSSHQENPSHINQPPQPSSNDQASTTDRNPPQPNQDDRRPHQTNNLEELKQEILTLLNSHLQNIASQVSTNTSRIEFILNTIFERHNA